MDVCFHAFSLKKIPGGDAAKAGACRKAGNNTLNRGGRQVAADQRRDVKSSTLALGRGSKF
jgi:hypothetical protein